MRRQLPILLLVLAAQATAPRAHAAGAVMIMNSGEATLSILDLATEREIRRIPVLREPHHVMPTPDGKEVLVGDTVANELYAFDPVTFRLIRSIPTADPYQLGFSPDGRYLVINGLARNQVDVLDARTFKLVKRFPLKSMPSHMAFSPDATTVYVSLQGTGRLAAISLAEMKLRWSAEVGPAPAGVMWNHGRVLVAIMGSDDVAVVDPATGRVERRVRTGKGAHQLFPTPDGKSIYVNNRVDGTAVVLNAATLAPERTYKLPGGPDDIVFAPDGKVWFTLRFVHKVAVLDPVSGTYRSIEVGRSPHGIYLNARAEPK